ncbi:MAG: hydrogenase [Piscirickettsiaceae bacterium]|nr:MAG: hydrogenase [Piscirickettsiaceae bacterium]
MTPILPSLLMGFREGLEAFLLIAIVLQYLTKAKQSHLKVKVFQGAAAGLLASIILGVLLTEISQSLGGVSALTKVWESAASFIALALVTFFIIWMIRHGGDMAKQIQQEVASSLSAIGVFFISFVVIAREGTEIAIFSFAGKYPAEYVAIGLVLALFITLLVFRSLVRINLSLLFKITLAYLILQAGFLLGYAIHEGLSSLKAYGVLMADHSLFTKTYDLSKTLLSHKDGIIGIPLHVLFGWYSKPEIVQFAIQYLYTFSMFYSWHVYNKRSTSAA